VQKIGDEWVARATSPVLRVPSTLVPGESNFLLNPRHAGFLKLQFSEPLPFHFDPRLIERR
jgi:RES domain-containing protein